MPPTCNTAQVREAFCALAKRYHPDLTGRNTEADRRKIDLIITGYKILSNADLRSDYDRYCAIKRRESRSDEGFLYLPKNRIKYSHSLGHLLANRLLHKHIRHADRLHHLGQDVEIVLKPEEAQFGAIAAIELPVRMLCPLCSGGDPYCVLCRGLGRIMNTAKLAVTIRPPAVDGSVMDFDLLPLRPDQATVFTKSRLRIKISIREQVL